MKTTLNSRILFPGFIFFLLINVVSWGQTNPTAFDLSTGNFSFTTQTATSTSYPTNFQGWATSANNITTAETTAPGTDQSLVASGTSTTSGLSNLGASGFQFLSTSSSPNRKIGSLCVSINSTGRQNIQLTWTAQDMTSSATGTSMGLSLQYRLGTSGSFTNVGAAGLYTTSGTSQSNSTTYTNITLPSICDNQSVVHIRWIYYQIGTTGTARDAIRLDDISVSSTSMPACSGTPSPGNTLASVNPVPSGSSTSLSLQTATSGTGVTYQWQSSTDNSTWGNITGATSAAYSATPMVASYYRCNVTCSGNTTASNSTLVNLTYCSSTGPVSQGTDYFTNFTITNGITNINNTSTFSVNGYGDFTSQSASQYPGNTVNYSMTSPGVGDGSSFGIFIDWNQDFDFADANEQVYLSVTQPTTNPSGSFTVPVGALVGSTRMRIVVKDATGQVSSCNSVLANSETEDYSFTVVALPACSAPTSLAATASSPAQTTTTISGTFTAAASAPSGYLVVRTTTNSQPTPTTGTTYTVGSNAIGYIEYVGASAGSWSSTSLTAGTTYYYWVFSYNNTNCTGGPAYSSTTTTFNQSTTSCTGANLANLSYSNATPTYCSGVAISTNTATLGTTFGTVSYSVSPSLPTGLSLSSSTGNITGTPSSTSASTSYTVTADNGCFTTTATITIQVVTPLSGLNYTTSTATYCVGTQITSNLVTAITGGGTISFSSTSLPTGMSLNSSTGEISGTPASNSASSTYTITATNGGCSATKSLTIAVNNTLSNSVLSYSVSSPAYCASTAITTNSVALSPSTNNGTVTYSISPSLPTGLVLNTSSGSITGTPTVSQNSTSYTITATNSCASITANIAMTINALPTVSISSSTNTYCGTAITLNASGASSYIWSPSTGLTGTTGNSVDASPSSTTTYTVTGTDANGCVSTATKEITFGNTLTSISSGSTSANICNGVSINLSSSSTDQLLNPNLDGGFDSGATFSLNGWSSILSGTRTWQVGSAGTTSSGNNAAYVGSSISSNGNSALGVHHIYKDVTIPNGATGIVLTFNYLQPSVDNGYDYMYVSYTTTANTPVLNTVPATGYTNLFVNTATVYGSFTPLSYNLPNSLAGTTVRLVFTWKSDGVSPHAYPVIDNILLSSNLTYSWTSNPSGFTSTTQNPTSVAPTQTTTYSVTATNSFGCTSSADVTVTVNQPTITWTGATSTDPTVASNWNPSGVPCTVSDVTIPSGLMNYPTYSSLTISSGGTYTLQSGAQLTLTGTLTNNGTMTIESGATFKQGTSVTGTGTYNVKQTIDNGAVSGSTLSGRFWYLGSPLACTRSSSFGTAGSLNKVWEFTNGAYANVADATALTPTKGYVHRRSDASTTLTFSGQNLYAQDATLSLSNNAGSYAGWHLVSNPYTAYLDWNQIVSNSTGMSNTYYIRSYNSNNQDVDALISYNASSGLESNTSSFALGNTGSTTAQYIAPLQAFWVKVPPTSTLSSTAGQLNLQRAFTSHQTGNIGLKNTGVYPVLARVNLHNGAMYDQALIYMNEFMTNSSDQNDSEKMFVSGVASIYTMASGKKLVMNGLKNNKKKISVPLYLELPTSKVYQLQLSEYIMEDGLILLEDKQEGTIQDFTINDTYAFYANSGVLSNRFVLHFYMPDAGVSAQGPSNSWVEEESVINEGGSILVSSNGRGKVTINQDIDATPSEKGSVVVRDAAGREIYNGQLTGSATNLELDAPSGIYFVSVELNGQVEVKKIFVQH